MSFIHEYDCISYYILVGCSVYLLSFGKHMDLLEMSIYRHTKSSYNASTY